MSKKSLTHAIVSDYLHVAKEIGRPPSQEYYLQHGIYSKRNIDSTFGGWTQLIQAAGYQIPSPKRMDEQEIRKQTHLHLIKEVDAIKNKVYPPKIYKSLLCVSDQHHPYGHPDIVPFLTALKDKYNFDGVLIGGDEIDAHAMSFHDHDQNLFSAGHELEEAIRKLKPLYELFPEAIVLSSNHGDLFYRKGKHHGFPRQVLKSYNEILQAPKSWEWVPEKIFQFSNGKKAIAHHGYSPNILLASKKRAMSLIQFHFHSMFSINYWQNAENLFWTMQCACLIDDTSYAYAYNKLGIERPIMGVGAVFDGLPKLLPMILNDDGRWNGFIP